MPKFIQIHPLLHFIKTIHPMSLELSTRKQVADYFGVNYDTVCNWEKKEIIKPSCTINGRPRYQLSEVIEAITKKKGGATCN